MPDQIQYVLLDLDGTLADTAQDLADALNHTLEQSGRTTLPLETIRPSVSQGSIAMIKLAFGLTGTEPEFDDVRNRFLQRYSENIAEYTTLFPGMEKVLQHLEDNAMPWGIVTNKTTWLTVPLMRALQLHERAGCIVCGDTVEFAKPHPAPMLHACEILGCTPKQTIYVGDARRDVEAGRNAGMKTLVASYGYIDADEQPETWGADGMVDTPLEILNWL